MCSMSAAMDVLNRNASRSLRDLLDEPVRPPGSSAGSASAPEGSPSPVEREGAPEETRDALDAAPVPRAALVPGAYEHEEAAQGVRAVAVHEVLRVDHVAAALAHLLRVLAQDDALVEEPLNGSPKSTSPRSRIDLGQEAGVEQVQHRVLDAAGVLVYREPLLALAPGRTAPRS